MEHRRQADSSPGQTRPEPGRRTIGHVVLNLDVGGLERVVIALMTATDASRYRVVLYPLGTGGALAGELERRGIAVRPLRKRPGLDYFLLFRLARMLKRDRVDIVHCHNYSPLVYGTLAARLAGAAGAVYTAHGARTSSRRGTRHFQRLGLVDEIVFVSDDARRTAIGVGAVGDRHVHTVRNGVAVAEYARPDGTRARVRHALGIPPEAPVVGIVARLTRAKDHVNLFDAMREVRRRHASARCVVVGDGELRDELRVAVAERALGDAVIFTGTREDVPDVLSAFDVFVLSSATEGLAVTLLEAMAAGLPVVATAVGGNPEVVVEGVTGRIVPPRDPVALGAAIADLLSDAAGRRRFGDEGRRRAAERFSTTAMVKSYEHLYHTVLTRARRGGHDEEPLG